LTVEDVPITAKVEAVVNGSVLWTSGAVEFAIEVLDTLIVLVRFPTAVVDSVETLVVLSEVVLFSVLAGDVITAPGEGVTKVKMPVVEIQLAEFG